MDQKSFEGANNEVPRARKRKYYLVHPVTQAQVSEVWREVWEINITFCFKGTFCRQNMFMLWTLLCHVISMDCSLLIVSKERFD